MAYLDTESEEYVADMDEYFNRTVIARCWTLDCDASTVATTDELKRMGWTMGYRNERCPKCVEVMATVSVPF